MYHSSTLWHPKPVFRKKDQVGMGDKISFQAPIFESSDFFTPEFIEENRALGIGREWFKSNRIGSDGFIQLSYQIAYRLIRSDSVSIDESCETHDGCRLVFSHHFPFLLGTKVLLIPMNFIKKYRSISTF